MANSKSTTSSTAAGGGFYFLGFLGAFIYFISTSENFGEGFIGFLKSLVWPAFLVFEAFQAFGS
jgi:hypothetical protein